MDTSYSTRIFALNNAGNIFLIGVLLFDRGLKQSAIDDVLKGLPDCFFEFDNSIIDIA